MSLVLGRTVEASEIVRALRPYGLTQADVGTVVGVSDRAVRSWSHSAIRPERYDRLTELRDVILLLSDSLSPKGVGQWMHARNRLLGGERPIEALSAGRFDEVRSAAQAFVEGSYV